MKLVDLKIKVLVDYYDFIGEYVVITINDYDFFYLGRYYRVYTSSEHYNLKKDKADIHLTKKFFDQNVTVILSYDATVTYNGHQLLLYAQKV